MTNTPVKLVKCTLVFPRKRDGDSILLAQKARGFGLGKWMGFGGKVERDETVDAAAVREFHEETGTALAPDQLSKVGLLLFSFACKPGFFLEVHVYQTYAVPVIPDLCDEFSGSGVWFAREDIPYEGMWADFPQWAGMMFEGQRFRARIAYDSFDTILESAVESVEDESDQLYARDSWFSCSTSRSLRDPITC